MSVRSAASHHCRKVFLMGFSLFRHGFNTSKCKTMSKMAVARVELLRNKREVVIKQMRRDIAMLLESGQDATARIRVEHVIREQNIMAANELIELFCELIVARLTIIVKQRECPADLKEGISSLIFAAPRCSDIPELSSIRDVFQKKYGKDFVSAATDLRPNAGVNRMLIEKLSVKTPSGEIKLKVLKEIAKEYQVQWDTTESEEELLKPPEERIEGPEKFVSAASLPLKPGQKQYAEPINDASDRGQCRGQSSVMTFQDLASAARIAAEKALAASEAAAVLAAASNQGVEDTTAVNSIYHNPTGKFVPNCLPTEYSTNDQKIMKTISSDYSHHEQRLDDDRKMFKRQSYSCQRAHMDIKFDESGYDEKIEMEEPQPPSDDARKVARRHNHNVPPAATQTNGIRYDEYDNEYDEYDRKMFKRQSYSCQRAHTDIKFDESGYDEKIDMEEPQPPSDDARKVARRHSYNVPPAATQSNGIRYDEYDNEYTEESTRGGTNGPSDCPTPQVPVRCVHPKLPDYESLAARFEALKHRNKQN